MMCEYLLLFHSEPHVPIPGERCRLLPTSACHNVHHNAGCCGSSPPLSNIQVGGLLMTLRKLHFVGLNLFSEVDFINLIF